ncbi:ABC transporter substrate-binding protein [Roseomonas sp. M0104]|uniref:ABC transporter substrate-binding protein n=1 Tax=Teichococcus coralli TaxID=2545983 RepID=A0A845B9B4_9PROT|nr:ABC transporter substrate-binding protein [Pseudoroseomonas coralli]MXP61982.1 ABC transporter substrate-binding protein [Pseudoroseomonas coralli]
MSVIGNPQDSLPRPRPLAGALRRRALLSALGAGGLSLPLAGFAPAGAQRRTFEALLDAPPTCLHPIAAAVPAGETRKLKLAWNATSVCTSPVEVARRSGILAKHGLEVELVNFGGSTEMLLEAIATRKADAGVGMALRWLKPLEMGFDVKVTGGTHGGCLRLIGAPGAGITTDIESVRGKTIAVSDMAAAEKNFFAMLLKRRGLDPDRDVTWRVFPAHVFALALERGEAQLVAANDPIAWKLRRDKDLVEVATNLSGEWADRACCIIGVSGALVRNEPQVAAALTRALAEAQHAVAMNPELAADAFVEYTPGKVTREDLLEILKSHTHGHSPTGPDIRREIELYAEELKSVGVLRASTDPKRFAARVTADVLSA